MTGDIGGIKLIGLTIFACNPLNSFHFDSLNCLEKILLSHWKKIKATTAVLTAGVQGRRKS